MYGELSRSHRNATLSGISIILRTVTDSVLPPCDQTELQPLVILLLRNYGV